MRMLEIRRATQGDIPALVPLLGQLFAQEAEFTPDAELQARGLAEIIGNESVGTVLVAEQAGRAVGMVNMLYTISTALGARVAILEDVVVNGGDRGAGIGSRLLAQAIETARADGCRRITLLTDSSNTRAQVLYGRLGFVRSAMVPLRLALGTAPAVE